MIKRRVNALIKEFKLLKTNPESVVFDHLPKCGGSTVNDFLTSAYSRIYTFGIDGSDPQASIQKFKKLNKKRRFKTKLIYGHMANELFDFVNPESIIATVLRDPIDRIVSHYYYAKKHEKHYLHNLIKDKNISLDEYCDYSDELQNWYVFHFSGLSQSAVVQNPDNAIELALKNILNKYQVIGFQKDISSFILELKRVANINKEFKNEFVNKTKHRVKIEEIDSNTLKNIASRNALDLIFFEKLVSVKSQSLKAC